MKGFRALSGVLLLLLASGCGARRTAQPSQEMSGFLDDYSLLRAGRPGEVARVYRNPNADWARYDRVLLEPVTLWRSGRRSLDPVPENDLLRLVSAFESALRRQIGAGFRLVDEPGPGVMRIRLAITEARASDPILDVLRAHGPPLPAPSDGPLDPELRRFVAGAAIEGEIRDAQTNELLSAGVDRRREGAPPLETWAELNRALDGWAERLCERLERRTGERKQ